jgi:hypothetical protein
VIEDVASIQATPPHGGDFVEVVADYYLNWSYEQRTGDPDGQGRIQDVDGEWRKYDEEPYEKVRWTFAPPVLIDEGAKLQRDWFQAFLLDPVPLRQQMRVRMPTFRWEAGEAAAVAGYFAHAAHQAWPARYALELLLALGQSPAEAAAECEQLGIGMTSAQIAGIAAGQPVETQAAFDELQAYGAAKGFELVGPPNPDFEEIRQRAPSTLDAALASSPELFDQVHRLALEGPNCFQCHFLRGAAPTAEGPIAWAPDLDITRERLRVAWTREWLWNPASKYPGTAMPANLPPDQDVYQDLLPRPSREQIEAVLMWLFNLDRAALRN